MYRRELKINFKAFVVWVSIIIGIFLIAFLVYPSIIKSGKDITELVRAMPSELLALFKMDIIGINTVSGWLATEGYMMVMILGGCFFAMMGASILLKEEDEGTIAFLYSLPLHRYQILTKKLLVGFTFVILFNLVIAIVTMVGLILSHDFNLIQWGLMALSPVLLHFFFFCLMLLVSVFCRKTNKSIMMGMGIVLGTYILQTLGMLNERLSFLKYLSPYEYVNISTIILENRLNVINLLILSVINGVIILILYQTYFKKELNA